MRLFNSAREYHERTKYSYDDVKFVYQEFSAEPQPSHIKDYPGYPVVQLPQNYNLKNKNLTESLKESQSFNQFSKLKDSAVDLQKISQLLYLINGITLVREFPRKKILLRASPSASALYPTEIYLYANKVSGLESALYYFHPHKHQLIKINGANIGKELIEACYGLDFLKAAPAHLVFTSVFSRSSWKFKNRAYRYCLMDGGYIAQNLLLAAASLDLKSNLIGDFVDENVNNLLGIDGSSEAAILMASIGKDAGPINQESYTFYMNGPEDDVIDELHKSLVRGIHLNSSHYLEKDRLISVKVTLPFGKAFSSETKTEIQIDLPTPKCDFTQSTHQIIKNRRSSHNFLRIAISLDELSEILNATRYVPMMYNYPAHNLYLIVNDIEHLENGVYRYLPDKHKLELLRKGTYRGDISYLTLAQDAVFNCSVAFFFSTDFEAINIFSNRGYRYAHFNVGMYSEAIYLASTALGIGVRGIGNFFDDSLNTFFRVNEPNENILGGVIVGHF